MIFTKFTALTKDCPDCITGKEIISYSMAAFTKLQAVEHFVKSEDYNEANYYVIQSSSWSTVWTIYQLSVAWSHGSFKQPGAVP